MSESSAKRVLVVVGDYDILQNVRALLKNTNFLLQHAFSRQDALYSLAMSLPDSIIVDAAMIDRQTGESALNTLTRYKNIPPIIAIDSSGNIATGSAVKAVVNSLQDHSLLRSLSRALAIAPTNTGELFSSSDIPQHFEEIQTLFSLGQSLTEVLDLSEVLNRVVEAARRLTGAEEGMILLPDEGGNQLYLRAKVGIENEAARNFRIKTKDSLAGQVFSLGQPVLIGAQGLQKVKTEYLVNSLLYVPILLKGEPIGVLGVNNKVAKAVFTLTQQELLMNLASYAAIAIENARNHEEIVERARELSILVATSQVVNSSLSLDKTLPNICEQLMLVLNAGWVEIMEWDRPNNRLRTLARSVHTLWRSGEGPRILLSKRPTLRTALEGNRYYVVRHDSTNLAGEAEFLHDLCVETALNIPVVVSSQALGAVHAYYVNSPEALPNRDVFQQIQNVSLEILAGLSENLKGINHQHVYRLIDDVLKLSGADWCELALFDPEKQSLTVRAAAGKGVWPGQIHPSIDLVEHQDLSMSMQRQIDVNVQADDSQLNSGGRLLLEYTSSRALLALPMVQRGEVRGLVLFGDSTRSRLFSRREIDMGRAIVGQAATALENARLVHDLERSLKELKETQDRLIQTARLSAMGELAAAVAHQINNPLTTILVDAEMMIQDEPTDSNNYSSLTAIYRAGKRAAGVVRRLLATARSDTLESPEERIDVLETIEGVLSLVMAHIQRGNIRVNAYLPEEPLPPVWAGQGQLDDVWLNLLLNAHDALLGRPNAEINIRAGYNEADDRVEVTVWDNGPGIPEHVIKRIFDPFFTTKPVGQGTGLGLHICRQVIDRVGGSISVESVLNEGARFIVRLPVKR